MRAAPPRSAPADSADDFDTDDRPSKSALKRQMHELQALGLALAELPVSRSSKLDLPDQLRDALQEYHRTRSHEGRRRQVQFIGKLMRQIDPEPVREAVAAFKLGSAAETLALHGIERWREELMASDDAVTRWMADYPETDAQQLRNLLRSARKDAGKAAPGDGLGQRHGRAYRDLFQLIKSALAAPVASASDEDDGEAHDA